jgi:hypothetical protein
LTSLHRRCTWLALDDLLDEPGLLGNLRLIIVVDSLETIHQDLRVPVELVPLKLIDLSIDGEQSGISGLRIVSV